MGFRGPSARADSLVGCSSEIGILRQPTASFGSKLLSNFLGPWPRSHAALSATGGDGGPTRMTEFHEDRGNVGGVKRGYISSRFLATGLPLRAPNPYLGNYRYALNRLRLLTPDRSLRSASCSPIGIRQTASEGQAYPGSRWSGFRCSLGLL